MIKSKKKSAEIVVLAGQQNSFKCESGEWEKITKRTFNQQGEKFIPSEQNEPREALAGQQNSFKCEFGEWEKITKRTFNQQGEKFIPSEQNEPQCRRQRG